MSLLLLACTGIEEPGFVEVQDSAAPVAEDPVEYTYVDDEEDQGDPLLSLAELEQGVADGLGVHMLLDPRPFHQVYEGIRAHGDAGCPYYYDYYYETYGQHYWYDTCTTDDGTRFSGNGRSYSYSDYVSGDYTYDFLHYFYGSAKLTTPQGDTLTASGYSHAYQGLHTNGYTYTYQNMSGDYRWDGPEADGTWLSSDLSLDIYMSISEHPTAGKYVSLSSSLSGAQGPVNAMVMDGVVLYDEGRGSACPIEPSGTISLRDADGDWYDLDFHGPRAGATTVFPPDCDGCGEVWWRGQYLGDVCPDFALIMGWEEVPWL